MSRPAHVRRCLRLLVVAALVAGTSLATETAASAAPVWSVTPTPSPLGPVTGALSAVACPTTTTCFAVGDYETSGSHESLVQRWNGTSWSILPSPNPSGATETLLRGISCVSDMSCIAVGSTAGPHAEWAFAERWDGTAWTIVPSATAPGTTAILDGVSCVSATSCFAVGAFESGRTGNKSLVERWNGSSFTTVASPNPAGSTSTSLASVACTSATNCFAVGSYEAGGINSLVERWNGTSWSIVSAPAPAGSTLTALSGVSCVSDSECFAVGVTAGSSGGTKTLIEHWDGTGWSIVASPNPASSSSNALQAVSCTSATSCFAFGYLMIDSTDGSSFGSLAEAWDGTSWSTVSSPNPAQSRQAFFEAVSCSSATSCIAVGYNQPIAISDGTLATLAERWDGAAWTITPNPVKASRSELSAVSCPSTTSCFAVGDYFNGTVTRPTLQRWNGTAWSTLPGGNISPAAIVATLTGISCSSPTQCFAVGSYSTSTTTKSLIERWNGTSWSVVTSPNPAGSSSTVLSGVSCASATSCFAVGTFTGKSLRTYAERWNGTSWSIIAVPNSGATNQNVLLGVSCSSATSCFAVGRNLSVYGRTLIERWNGTSWSLMTSANPSASDSALLGVSCISATNCIAVGRYVLGEDSPVKTLVERWNGTAWKIVTSANRFPEFNLLTAVSCRSATSCFAVGSSTSAAITPTTTLVEQWNGTAFSIVSSPNSGSARNFLKGISCVNSAYCRAVGGYEARGSRYTLAERYG